MKLTLSISICIIVLISISSISFSQEQKRLSEPIFGKYDIQANPDSQLHSAVQLAKKSGKRILMEVGGEWCKWCHYLDDFFAKNLDVTEYLKGNFILLKINFSKENDNEYFLSKYPKVAGYPHIFVLDENGALLHSQDTGKLEEGQGHSREKVLIFLKAWAINKP